MSTVEYYTAMQTLWVRAQLRGHKEIGYLFMLEQSSLIFRGKY